MVVEVFKTNVMDSAYAAVLINLLSARLPHCDINFDLDDCDRILRVAGKTICVEEIKIILGTHGFLCECLE